ncbi:MAG TPA: malectin domain-containing carbohydrate-binding protein, partial [bacterium]
GTPTPTYQPQLTATNNVFDPTATGYQDTFGTAFNPATFINYYPASYTQDSAGAVPTMAVSGPGPCGNLATPTPTPATAPATVWRVSAGRTSYIDGQGHVWAADTQYLGGYSYAATALVALSGTTDPTLYQTERYGNLFNQNFFSYSFPVSPGFYQVTLKFAETDFTAPGQRIFNVAINGMLVLSNFDIFTDAGASNKADDKVFEGIAPISGQILVQFSSSGADSPKVNALQVVPSLVTPTPTPPRPNGAPYVYSNPSSGPMVRFVYAMAENGKASIKIWNASGNLAASLEEPKPTGVQQSVLDITAFAAGHYFYQVDLLYDSGREEKFEPRVLAIKK